MTSLRIHMRHFAQEEFLLEFLIKAPWILLDGTFADRKKSTWWVAHRCRHFRTRKELLPVLGGSFRGTYTRHRRPFLPARILLPRNTVPVVEALEFAEGERGDLTVLCFKRAFYYLTKAYVDVVVDAALEEDRYVGESIVTLDDMVEVSMPFPADIWELVVRVLWSVSIPTLGVDAAGVDFIL